MVSGWCPCVPLGRRESPRPQFNNHVADSASNLGGPYTVSAATDQAEMVQMFYYENRGKCCKKLLRYNGYPSKVVLFPDESWARSASTSYWTLTPLWWSRSRCKIVEVAGTRRCGKMEIARRGPEGLEEVVCEARKPIIDDVNNDWSGDVERSDLTYSTQGKMVDMGMGTLYIVGTFKRMPVDRDFKLYLTSNVSSSDFNMGYSMTGMVERGCKKTNSFQLTHFAVIRRRDYEKAYEDPNPT